ncbi:MAG: hypothetical protein FWH27_18260 [Planctomycetaceae bacterium]|nr:hypothetical protein [Planctomycetaceae bacterium]
MKCESCKTREIEIEIPKGEDLEEVKPYRLCFECGNRLQHLALRPLEFFNLAAIHGHCFYLHDDFYDWDTGEAMAPEIDVIGPEKFPFPTLEDVKNDLNRLIGYSFAQYNTDNIVIEHLQKFNKTEVLDIIDQRVKYNNSIAYKAYEIVSCVIGKTANNWARDQWENRVAGDSILTYAELISNCFEFEEAFEVIKNELEKSGDKTFNDDILALLYLKNEKSLDWLETQTERMKTVMWNSSFGQLAACSQFSWRRCEKWLRMGRPLSLIALDALCLCTTKYHTGLFFWSRKQKPTLTDHVEPETMANRLRDYLKIDGVPRTQKIVEIIMNNHLFEMT